MGSERVRDRALLVATDLDGCLLDEDTYSHEAARPALAALAHARVPLVLCSSKTRAEMTALARVLGDPAPLVVENGGAVVVPPGLFAHVPGGVEQDGFVVLPLGEPRVALVAALATIAEEMDAELRGFAGMGLDEIERLTGLPRVSAEQAQKREYDEPFLAPAERQDELARAAEKHGLQLTRGGRFFHLTGRTDKGRALRRLLDLWAAEGRTFETVALGDSPNDLELLRAVDRPVLIPRRRDEVDAELAAALPHAERAPRPGPAGWNEAVLAVLSGRSLPRVGGA